MSKIQGAQKQEIFVSYSHRDEEAKDFVSRHLKVLQSAGSIDVWDDRKIIFGDDWYQNIEAKLNASAVAVLLISTDFLGSEFCIKEEVSRLLERRRRDGMMIAPILLRPCAWRIFPWLAALQMQPRDDVPLLDLDQIQQERELTDVVLAIHKFLQEKAELIVAAIEKAKTTGQRTEVRGDSNTIVQVDGDDVHVSIVAGPRPGTTYAPLPNNLIDLTRLPTSGFDVVGRDQELQFLNEALDDSHLNIVSLRAWGGIGKSTLANKWCQYLAADNFRGAKRVFAWSFYSQGISERVASADAFIDQALRFFGEDEPTQVSPWARGERLADLVAKEKALLILDGMEPLQDEHQGIKDPALARLVECLADENAGLCVITTRESVKELADFPETTREIDLEQLSKDAGRALLRIKGLRAPNDLLEQTSEAFGNHALALDLLASHLKRFAASDVSQALGIADLPDVTVAAGRHPRRVMAAFAEQLGDGPALDLLHIMGLFDRPADAGCIAALRASPAIPGLTGGLTMLDEIGWRDLLETLRGFGLLATLGDHEPDQLDAHPLVREHFGEWLKSNRPDAWRAGHERLYEHLKSVPNKHRPDTLAEMAPLIQAAHHGCLSGRRQEVLDEIYDDRICRKNELYLTRKLGAFGAELGLVASFFDIPFELPAADLKETDRAWALIAAAFDLRSLGRIGEAVAPTKAALKMQVKQARWRQAAISADHLCELHLALGDIAGARSIGKTAVDYADRSGDLIRRITNRTALAETQHQGGYLKEARTLFQEAEALQAESDQGHPMLYAARGYRYCDLQITLGQPRKDYEQIVSALVRTQQSDDSKHGDLFSIAFNHLSLGRTSMALGRMEEAEIQLNAAVDAIRAAGAAEHLPRGLLARAALFREAKVHGKSRRDLDEAMRIATRCGMRLQECDTHLELTRLSLDENNFEAARTHLQSAGALVVTCEYHRRAPELRDLRERLGQEQ